jgi:hypothetical protein
MVPTNPPPANPFRAGSDEAGSTRARTWNSILFHIQDTPVPALASISTPLCMLTISKLDLHNAPTKSRNAESSCMVLASNGRCMAVCTLSESTSAGSGVLRPGVVVVVVVAVSPALQSVFHRVPATAPMPRCAGPGRAVPRVVRT